LCQTCQNQDRFETLFQSLSSLGTERLKKCFKAIMVVLKCSWNDHW